MRLNDLCLGFLVLAGGIALLASGYGFSPIPGQRYGADTLPKAVGFCAIALGLFMAGRAVLAGERRPAVAVAAWARSPAAWAGLAATLGLVAFYVLASPRLGFLPVAFAVLAALMLLRRVRPLVALPVSLAAAVVIEQAFGRLLLVPLPRGALSSLVW